MSYFAAFARTKPTYARAEATLRRAGAHVVEPLPLNEPAHSSSQYVRVLWANGSIQNISGLHQGLAGRTAAGWRRQGDGAGNKWRYERVYALTKLPLAGVLPWLSRPTWTASMPIPKPSESSMSRLK